MARTKRRSATIRAVAVVPPLHCVALCHVGDRRYSPGPPLRPAGCRARLNRRTIAAVASLDAARRVGETRSRWSACGSGRVRSLRPGPQGRALAGTARLGFVYSAARSPTKLVPLKRLHGRRRFAPAWRLPLCAADRSGEKLRRSFKTRAVAYASVADASEPPLTSFASCAA